MYTNKIHDVIRSNVITFDVADHLATLTTISLDSNSDSTHRHTINNGNTEQREFRMFNAANDAKFKQLITDQNWDIPDDLDADSQYNLFFDIYSKHYDTAYPLITKRTRRKHERLLPKPWILPWLEDACDRKNHLYHVWVKNPTAANEAKYKKMKNSLKNTLDVPKTSTITIILCNIVTTLKNSGI